MTWLVRLAAAVWIAATSPAFADTATFHISGMGVGQVVDHDRPMVGSNDYTANTLYHDDPGTVASITIRMPENAVREGLTDAEFRRAIANELRAQVDAHWRAGRRTFEIHLIQDNTLLKHVFHEFGDVQDDVAKFSRAAYGAIGDVLAERERMGHEIAVDATLGSNDTAGFVLATAAWRDWEHMIRRVTLVDGRAPLGKVREALDILGGPRVRIVNSQFDAPAAPDWTGVFQNIAFLGNSERLHKAYPGLQLLWVRPTEELIITKGHIRTLMEADEYFEVSLYLGNGFYADLGDFTGRQIHPPLDFQDYERLAAIGLPPVGRGYAPLRGLVYDRHAALRLGADLAFELSRQLILIDDVMKVAGGAEPAFPFAELQALVESLHHDLQSAGLDGSVEIGMGTLFDLARLQLAVAGRYLDVSDAGTLGMIEGALRLERSPWDPEAVTLLLDGFSDLTAALAGINPAQVKVAREIGRRASEHSFRRIWYDLSGAADEIVAQAEARQRLAVEHGAEPLPLDQLLGPEELAVVGHWRRALFDRLWDVRASPSATVTARHEVRRETCIAGRCGTFTLRSGTGRAVGVYGPALRQTALDRAVADAGTAPVTAHPGAASGVGPLVWPASRDQVPEPGAAAACPAGDPDCATGRGWGRPLDLEEICRDDPDECRYIPETTCADRNDCPPPINYWPLYWNHPGDSALAGNGPDDQHGGGGGGPDQADVVGDGGGEPPPPGGGGGDEPPGGPGGVVIAPAFTDGTGQVAPELRTLLSGCDFAASASCDLSP